MFAGVVVESGVWAGRSVEVVVEVGSEVWARMLIGVGVEDEPSVWALFEVFGFDVVVVAGVGGLVGVVIEVGTGAFVEVDSDEALHVSPHVSGGLAEMSW